MGIEPIGVMLSIFNFFLLLFAWWGSLILAHGSGFSWFYILFGVTSVLLITIVSLRSKMIEKRSEMLYFNIGFYRHFLSLLLRNFLPSIRLLIDIAIFHRRISPVVARIQLRGEKESLLISSLNMTAGIICTGINQDLALLHAVNHEYLRVGEIKKIRSTLKEINDDILI